MQEYQSCNTLPCPELKKTTPWTPWTPVNISDNGGHYEQRFRYTCKARIPDPSLLEVGRQRIEMRYCSSDGSTGCSTDGETRHTDGPCLPLDSSVLSHSNWLTVSLRASYWSSRLEPFLLSVWLSLFLSPTSKLFFILLNFRTSIITKWFPTTLSLLALLSDQASDMLMKLQSTKPIKYFFFSQLSRLCAV